MSAIDEMFVSSPKFTYGNCISSVMTLEVGTYRGDSVVRVKPMAPWPFCHVRRVPFMNPEADTSAGASLALDF